MEWSGAKARWRSPPALAAHGQTEASKHTVGTRAGVRGARQEARRWPRPRRRSAPHARISFWPAPCVCTTPTRPPTMSAVRDSLDKAAAALHLRSDKPADAAEGTPGTPRRAPCEVFLPLTPHSLHRRGRRLRHHGRRLGERALCYGRRCAAGARARRRAAHAPPRQRCGAVCLAAHLGIGQQEGAQAVRAAGEEAREGRDARGGGGAPPARRRRGPAPRGGQGRRAAGRRRRQEGECAGPCAAGVRTVELTDARFRSRSALPSARVTSRSASRAGCTACARKRASSSSSCATARATCRWCSAATA